MAKEKRESIEIDTKTSSTVKHIEFNGKRYPVDSHGFLTNSAKWDDNWVTHVQKEEDIENFTKEHTRLWQKVKAHHEKIGLIPSASRWEKETGFLLEKTYQLFADGPRGVCKMVGVSREEFNIGFFR